MRGKRPRDAEGAKTKSPLITQRAFSPNSGGEGGIRTPDRLLTYTRFPGVRLKPLIHLSGTRAAHYSQGFFCAQAPAHSARAPLKESLTKPSAAALARRTTADSTREVRQGHTTMPGGGVSGAKPIFHAPYWLWPEWGIFSVFSCHISSAFLCHIYIVICTRQSTCFK